LNSQPKIDEIDIHILKALMRDSRTSFADIAKECGMSTNSIRMRFNLLKKTGVITGSTILLNPKMLGYEGVAFLGINSDIDKEQRVLEFLHEIPNISLSKCQIGKHNIISIILVKNIEELVHTVDLIRSNPQIWRIDTAISEIGGARYHLENVVFKPFNNTSHNKEQMEKTESKNSTDFWKSNKKHRSENINPSFKLDKIDLLIIKTLRMDTRASFRNIGKKLGISTKTVIKRFEKLQKELKFKLTLTLDLKKLGYPCCTIFCIIVSDKKKLNNVLSEISKIPNVITTNRCIGDIEIMARALLANYEELFKLRQRISEISGIKEIEILLDKNKDDWPRPIFPKSLQTS
jgi:Lrp/AsnC family transcriptional regulator for asnA, asnC and gidA